MRERMGIGVGVVATCALLAMSACGGSGSGTGGSEAPPPSAQTFTVMAAAGTGGSISPASETVASGGMTTFTVTPSAGYGIGTVSGCGGSLSANTFTTGSINSGCSVRADFIALGPIWTGGADTGQQAGVYGTQSQSGATNRPGARSGAISWSDVGGNLWLFGGFGTDSTGATAELNDLWRYAPTTGEWIWESGSNTVRAGGVYGTQGQPAAANVPGARSSAAFWTDAGGDLWLFGGFGYDSNGRYGNLNDLWKYTPSTGEWTWESGSDAGGESASQAPVGVYGTRGQAAATNVPGARSSAVAWTDASGNLWLFGGFGYDSIGIYGDLNDLWEYTPSTGEWTWTSGCDLSGCVGLYSALGQPSPAVRPGARDSAIAWTDARGNLWLFGGSGVDTHGIPGILNDLWKYTPTTGEWTWESGSGAFGSFAGVAGVYGTRGQPAATNVPGSRDAAVAWTDTHGNLWLFGGFGYDSAATFQNSSQGRLNDLWKYSPSTGQWTWEGGSNIENAVGVYGTLGQPAATNVPGARSGAVVWSDARGSVWLFGGNGYDSAGLGGGLNDLWWLQGSSSPGCSGFGCP